MQSHGPPELCPQAEGRLVWLCSVVFNKKITFLLFEGSVSDTILSLPVGHWVVYCSPGLGHDQGSLIPRLTHSPPQASA